VVSAKLAKGAKVVTNALEYERCLAYSGVQGGFGFFK